MYQNYIKTAFRNMLKYKGFTFINIAGLTLGLAVCLLLFLWVKDEMSYDQFHKKADRIYRSSWEARFGENEWKIPYVPVPLAPTMVQEFPEVEKATQMTQGGFSLKKGTDYIREKNVLFVDEDFFDVFSINVLQGNPKALQNNLDAVFLSPTTAQRYFGEDAKDYQKIIGQSLLRSDNKLLQVAGIVEDFPEQSHLKLDFLASIKNLEKVEQRKTHWGSATVLTYFLLSPEGNPEILDKKLQAYVDKNIAGEDFEEGDNYTSFPFEPITQIHYARNASYIWIFGSIAFIILLLASINFINLSTARSLNRAKEVGLRKVLGSRRRQLVQQFFSESFLYVLIASILAVLLAQSLLPAFNQFAEKSLDFNLLNSSFAISLVVGLVAFTAIITGIFPSLVLSAFEPVKALKGSITKSKGRNYLRQTLVILQFCISGLLIIGTLVVKQQLHFIQNQDLGFNKEQVLILRGALGLGNNYIPFLNQLQSLSFVQRVSTAQFLPGDGYDSTVFIPEQPANYKQTSLTYSHIDPQFVDLLDLQLVEGRNFNPELVTDSTACLINETAAAKLGWDDPIGKSLFYGYGGQKEGKVIGVIKDFNFSSLHEAIQPIVFRMSSWNQNNTLIRLQAGNLNENIKNIQTTWKTFAPTIPFRYEFLDQEIAAFYKKEQRMSSVFSLFAVLAIFIACLGLLGLASIVTTQRTKEIGIRKVLGASISNLVALLSKDFLKPVVIALFIAVPLGWYLMNQWLLDFAYRVNIEGWVFVVAAILAIGIAFLTVSLQSMRAASANPIESLRAE